MNGKLLVSGLILLILQAGLGPLLTVGDARPSFILPFVVYVGLKSGPMWGTLYGFALGIAIDALGSLPLGMSALAFCTAGFVSGKMAPGEQFRLWWPWTTFVLIFAILFELLRTLLLARANALPFFSLMTWGGLPSALWTTGLAVLWFISPLHGREGSPR
ncbi:MAG: rod shape-determining protein MreD [bacterium]|nr:rod shape-determining protein MreD [bacterium]